MKNLNKWLIIGAAECLLSVVVVGFAPKVINSGKPMIGFAMLGSVPIVMIGSLSYIGYKVINAVQSKHILIQEFPEFYHISLHKFLEISPEQVKKNMPILQECRQDIEDKFISEDNIMQIFNNNI